MSHIAGIVFTVFQFRIVKFEGFYQSGGGNRNENVKEQSANTNEQYTPGCNRRFIGNLPDCLI